MKNPNKTVDVAIASERLSFAVAIIVKEFIFLPIAELNLHISNFNITEEASITIDAVSNNNSSGLKIFSTEDLTNPNPVIIIAIDTIKLETYSILPWPNGWSLSAGFAAILKHNKVIIEDPASERLLNASAVAATDDDAIPTTNFPANNKRFNRMPTIPLIIPNLVLTLGSSELLFFQKNFSKINLLNSPPPI